MSLIKSSINTRTKVGKRPLFIVPRRRTRGLLGRTELIAEHRCESAADLLPGAPASPLFHAAGLFNPPAPRPARCRKDPD